ncbi:hypothetical protein VoSk93_20590 [Vibrio owensii]
MTIITRLDSQVIHRKLGSILTIGNDDVFRSMVNLGSLMLEHSNYETLSKLDYLPTILLYGPPNTGKTTIVYRLFETLKSINNNVNLYYMDFSLIMSSEYGGTSKNVVSAFDDLISDCSIDNPKILLIDEIDQFCMSRDKANEHDASRRAMSSFMLELDRLHPSNLQGLIVVAISNVQTMLDAAVIRRFNLKIKVDEQLDFECFKGYINELEGLFNDLNLEGELGNLYDIYKRKRLTIPDVKGCFRDALSSIDNIEKLSNSCVLKAFDNAYSSVDNKLE